MSEIQEIIKQIEELRSSMVRIKEGKSLTDPEVVIASQMLDAVLNEYYKMLRQKLEEN
ncbi:aspartyl-phosphate phosphatase Spo0E family protein [Desulfosporosinus sp. PR]|uniref:aspartyl-phosphate phosphatase Spo0E family protein n=1 Tax=Candidatus Desulfosporosinus nitrosoreducens TaxID=3401928 RepID=UPI0027F1E18D|nr:aspartyl-phosphate phosphatase Spo0E family protein [Desulfosporosinus sp. PR]MDQ7092152.1 aspartyl-phosphate phosphatase Spo0E family protein [Desulfosporosinus sp. PR]